MISTLTPDTNGTIIWQSDVCEADLHMFTQSDMPPMALKVKGIMQYDIPTGSYTLTVHEAPQSMMGK